MAANLVKNGFDVKGFDVNTEAVEALAEKGVHGSSSVAEVSKDVS